MNPESLISLIADSQLLRSGGPVVAVLLALSFVALTVILVKFWQLFPFGIGSDRAIAGALRVWGGGDEKQAFQQVRKSRQPAQQVLAAAMGGLLSGATESVVREESTRVAAQVLEQQSRYLRVLEVIAALSPLLGLFGTVLGMIEAFQAMENAGRQVDPAVFSGGIWQALLTTAVGLAVAIPVAAVLSLFEGSIHRQRHLMEDALTRVLLGDQVSGQDG